MIIISVDLGALEPLQEGAHHRVLFLPVQDFLLYYVSQLLNQLVLVRVLGLYAVPHIVKHVMQLRELRSIVDHFGVQVEVYMRLLQAEIDFGC